MKHFIYVFLILLILITSTSCKKEFLDVQDKSRILQQVYVTDLKTTADYLNGVYILFSQNFYQWYTPIYIDLVADNIKLATASSSMLASQYNWSQISNTSASTNSNMNALWLDGYKIIRACNFVLEKSDEYKDQDPTKANNLRAQALSVRALVHFIMVNVFAQPYSFSADGSHPGIPYVITYDFTQPLNGRNSVTEVYSQVINDLVLANSLFDLAPTNSADVMYMTNNAAKALLARVYLFKGDYQAAKNASREVATSVPLLTIAGGYPNNLYKNLPPSQTEVLFQLGPSQSGISLPSAGGTLYTGTYTTSFQGKYFISTKQFIATTDIATLLTQNSSDVRKNWVTLSLGTWNITKYPSNVIAGFSSASASGCYYEAIIRSSEMYLIAAEAYAKLNNEDSARFYLNAIRKRANPTSITSTATGLALMDSIYTERRRELAFEGLRMFDLLRWKKGVSRTDAWSPTVQYLPYTSDKIIAPIPQSDVNIENLSQNPSY
jgi:hypothetical protein